MNKSELIDAIASAADISKAKAALAVDGMTSAVTQALSKGDQVTLVGFGTFSVRDRAARTGRNPKTGEPVHLEGKNVPHFKPGKEMRERVNESMSRVEIKP